MSRSCTSERGSFPRVIRIGPALWRYCWKEPIDRCFSPGSPIPSGVFPIRRSNSHSNHYTRFQYCFAGFWYLGVELPCIRTPGQPRRTFARIPGKRTTDGGGSDGRYPAWFRSRDIYSPFPGATSVDGRSNTELDGHWFPCCSDSRGSIRGHNRPRDP